jgi:hypothetical protein
LSKLACFMSINPSIHLSIGLVGNGGQQASKNPGRVDYHSEA